MNMLKWPKVWTGVEKKDDGTLVYNERGALFLFLKINKTYVINQSIYSKLKKIVLFEIIVAICLIVYIRSFSPLSYISICLILFLGLVLDSITGFFKNQIGKKLCT